MDSHYGSELHRELPIITGFDAHTDKPFPPRGVTFPLPPQAGPSCVLMSGLSQDERGLGGLQQPLSKVLRNKIWRQYDEKLGQYYISPPSLHTVMSRSRVARELHAYNIPQSYVECIAHGDDVDRVEDKYTKLFAILVRLGKAGHIGEFVEAGLSDERLPFFTKPNQEPANSECHLFEMQDSLSEIHVFNGWKVQDREQFERVQWEFIVHFFKLRPEMSGPLPVRSRQWVQSLHSKVYLPWKKHQHVRELAQVSRFSASGAQGSVSHFDIDGSSHDFHRLLHSIGLDETVFAVKTLQRMKVPGAPGPNLRDETDKEMETRFYDEVDLLSLFGGSAHPHLVALLTAFVHAGKFRLVFPSADCDLMAYWERDVMTTWSLDNIRWVAKQVYGLVSAVEAMHTPTHLHGLAGSEDRYGFHADITPENILFFRTTNPRDPGLLAVSDFGLSSLHRADSRSRIPNNEVAGAPGNGYRPPECDIEGGLVTRVYDVWTLGCLFLEMLTWLVGGRALLKEFQEERKTRYVITGGLRKMFYEVYESAAVGAVHIRGAARDTKRLYEIQVNPKVTQWVARLHKHDDCSDFVHEVLDLVQYQMMRVKIKERSDTKVLKERFKAVLANCEDSVEFCLRSRPSSNLQETMSSTPLCVELKEEAYDQIKEHSKLYR